MDDHKRPDFSAQRDAADRAGVRAVDPAGDESALRLCLADIARERNRPESLVETVFAALADRTRYRAWGAFGGDGTLLALGTHFQQNAARCYADVDVLPAWRRLGLGSRVLRRMVDETAQLGARWLVVDVPSDDAAAGAFLRRNGLTPRGDVWALLAPAETSFPAATWLDGYHVTTYDRLQDVRALTDAFNAAFGDMWGHWENIPGLVTVESVGNMLAEADARGIVLALDAGGRIAGFCHATPFVGEQASAPHLLDMPGVVPDHRHAGLHTPLVLEAAKFLQSQGPRPLRLESWSDPAETIALYEALGFERVLHEVSYGLDVA
jgi:GNAT superfamily N-acetyltransferase